MVHVHHLVRLHELTSLLFAFFHQVIAANSHATVFGQNGAALLQRGRRHAVHRDVQRRFALVGHLLVRQQAGHAQRRVAGQHAQHGFQPGFHPVAGIQLSGQLLGCLKAERIRDDHVHPLGPTPTKTRCHIVVVKRGLAGHVCQLPFVQQAALPLHHGIPSRSQVTNEPAGIGVLHALAQLMQQ